MVRTTCATIDVEVVVPEVDQHLEKLAFAPRRAQKRDALDLVVGLEAYRPWWARFHVVLPELGEGLGESGES